MRPFRICESVRVHYAERKNGTPSRRESRRSETIHWNFLICTYSRLFILLRLQWIFVFFFCNMNSMPMRIFLKIHSFFRVIQERGGTSTIDTQGPVCFEAEIPFGISVEHSVSIQSVRCIWAWNATSSTISGSGKKSGISHGRKITKNKKK